MLDHPLPVVFLTDAIPSGSGHISSLLQGATNMNYMKNMKLLPLVLQKIVEEQELVLLVAPRWSNQLWFLEIMELLVVLPWTAPLTRGLLSRCDTPTRSSGIGFCGGALQ